MNGPALCPLAGPERHVQPCHRPPERHLARSGRLPPARHVSVQRRSIPVSLSGYRVALLAFGLSRRGRNRRQMKLLDVPEMKYMTADKPHREPRPTIEPTMASPSTPRSHSSLRRFSQSLPLSQQTHGGGFAFHLVQRAARSCSPVRTSRSGTTSSPRRPPRTLRPMLTVRPGFTPVRDDATLDLLRTMPK